MEAALALLGDDGDGSDSVHSGSDGPASPPHAAEDLAIAPLCDAGSPPAELELELQL